MTAFTLRPTSVLAWTNGELLIWMDSERGKAVEAIAQKLEADLGVKVTVELVPEGSLAEAANLGREGKPKRLFDRRFVKK